MNSLGILQIRSLKPYSFSAIFRLEKPDVAKSLATWIESRLAKVGLQTSAESAMVDQEALA